MIAQTTQRTSYSRAELLWFGVVIVLCAMALFGSFEPDPFRRFAPRNTVLYASWKEGGARFARAYLADGSVSDLSNGSGITVKKSGDVPDTYVDPFPGATPIQRLRIRFSSAYGIRPTERGTHLIYGRRDSGVTTLIDANRSSVTGTPAAHLPGSLFLWSTRGEPIATMNDSDREPAAHAEGRYGSAITPSVVLRTQVPDADRFLKLITAFDRPKTVALTLDDGSIAKEVVAKTDGLVTRTRPSILGDIIIADSDRPVPLILPLGDLTSEGVPTLLLSSSSVLEETSHWSHPSCPITSLTSYVRQPFFALGTNPSGEIVFCAE